jgi:5-methylcytosine-specific restriction endonuclease McrA
MESVETPATITCAECGVPKPPAAFDVRFVNKPTRKTCTSCRTGGQFQTDAALRQANHQALVEDKARRRREQEERERQKQAWAQQLSEMLERERSVLEWLLGVAGQETLVRERERKQLAEAAAQEREQKQLRQEWSAAWAEITRRFAELDPPYVPRDSRQERGKISVRLRRALYDAQGGCCAYCGVAIMLDERHPDGTPTCSCQRCIKLHGGKTREELRAEHQQAVDAWLGEPIAVVPHPQLTGERRLETRIYQNGSTVTLYAGGATTARYTSDGFPKRLAGALQCVLGYLEHRIPLCRGGTNADENLAFACYRCNDAKGVRTEAEWRAYPQDALTALGVQLRNVQEGMRREAEDPARFARIAPSALLSFQQSRLHRGQATPYLWPIVWHLPWE